MLGLNIHRKAKPAARRGRKATGLPQAGGEDSRVAWMKAVRFFVGWGWGQTLEYAIA
jgi:hypothetical protein